MNDVVPALIGGTLIGLAAALFLLANGRICGVSGLLGGLVRGGPDDGRGIRAGFVGGLVLGGLALRALHPAAFDAGGRATPLALAALAGVLVGVGTQLGGGCTSGHGVCGVGRLSPRSLIATATFTLAGAATVLVVRHLLGGGR